MASNAAVPFWRAAGMTYITYSNICANLVRNCLKEPYKSEAVNREKVHFSVAKWADGKPQKPMWMSFLVLLSLPLMLSDEISVLRVWSDFLLCSDDSDDNFD
ncbi:hypothetical protein RHGRI_025245 [Rhododendron griersonianum]|uniref:ATP synthase subunit epsilon, mitochondrial n=1 Tax=Rhododendron griersonianum TaxID=479676 RepID=A0AAV6JD72_9ERIC|nr:hypothetical protein RHGRI_025245 [Rhododendron griersonianum]